MLNNFIVAENRYHQKILIDPNDMIGQKILQDGLYDKTGLFFIEKILSQLSNPVAFDIGASIGNHALRMSCYCQILYLFEPQKNIAAVLDQTMILNHIKNYKILNFGLSDQNATLKLYQNLESNVQTSFLPELKSENYIIEDALVCVGDEVVLQHNINQLDFIKIDVEGFEAKVISGLKNTIQKFRPIIFMEWDKEITKQQFKELHLFETIFQNYLIKAITRHSDESSLAKKILSKFKRLFSGGKRRRWVLGDFVPEKNYRHIVFMPCEKETMIDFSG